MTLPAMDMFIQIKGFPAAELVAEVEHIRDHHKTPGDNYIGGVCIEIIGDFDGTLETAALDALAPYFPGGSKETFDHLYVGSAIPDYQGPGSPYWEGIKDWQERERGLALQLDLWQKFADRYPQTVARSDFGLYINYEAVLEYWEIDPTVRWSFEHYFKRSLADADTIKQDVPVMWCPAFWTKTPPAGMRSSINTTWNNMIAETGRRIDRVDIEDMMGRNWIGHTVDDVELWHDTFSDIQPGTELTIDCELFEEPEWVPADRTELEGRMGSYLAKGLTIGHCFELRYWHDLHQDATVAPTPPPTTIPQHVLDAMFAAARDLGWEFEPVD